MRIALVQCPAFGIDRPPLALGYLAAILKKHEYETKCFDFNIDLYHSISEENKKFWDFANVYRWSDEQNFSQIDETPDERCSGWLNKILSFDPDIVGFSVHVTSLLYSVKLAKLIKTVAPGKIIIFGGPITSTHSLGHNAYLLQLTNDAGAKIVDVVVAGEGEFTLVDLVERIQSKNPLEGCKGSVVIREAGVLDSGPRGFINDLDGLPFPDFSDFALNSYANKVGNKLPILGSRGCVHKCVFCDDTVIWGRYRYRSAQSIFEEMRLRKAGGINILDFNDLLINGNYKQLTELCDLIIRSKLGIMWGASASIDGHLNFEILKKLKSAGCNYLNYGIESASPKVLKDMNKGFSIKEAERVIKYTHKAKINVCTNWIIGFPTETEEDFDKTLVFIKSNFKYIRNNIMVNSFMLKGKSFLFNNKEKFDIVANNTRDWSLSDGRLSVEERKQVRPVHIHDFNAWR